MKKTFDTILVLGISTKKNLFAPRVRIAVKLYKNGYAPRIIMSGRFWGGLPKRPRHTEARLMKRYAIQLGVPRKNILLDEKSLNTASNFFFVKKDILKPLKLHSLLVVTNKVHIPKARYLARKILGSKFIVLFIDDGEKTTNDKGHAGLRYTKRMLAAIKDGDDQAMMKKLKKHPYYKKYYVKI